MQKIINRPIDSAKIKHFLSIFPVTAILGPRQSGKTFLAKQLPYKHYFDLENPRDMTMLNNPQLALEDLEGLIVIDEIQRKPDLFNLIRYLVDTNPKQKYLILGSASGALMKQSSESLAGRIGYYYLGGFSISDIDSSNIMKIWLRGGYPRAYLAKSDRGSFLWLTNYISAFLERDIPQLGISVSANILRRFWIMLSHYHGQIINYSETGRSFGISDVTVKKYIDILEHALMLRVLQPWHVNMRKRLVKRPKIYIRDSGIFHSLNSIESCQQMLTHNKLGASWEGFALECVIRAIGKRYEDFYFWNTHTGAAIDLFWQNNGRNWGIEFKYGDSPKLTRAMKTSIEDLSLAHLWVVYPGKQLYKLHKNITVIPLSQINKVWSYKY
ncbi:ATP-binding protein [bacterium]|nr:ATP-binding protein [bacterium]MBU3954860.1 ATP-binding protein [bacterium]